MNKLNITFMTPAQREKYLGEDEAFLDNVNHVTIMNDSLPIKSEEIKAMLMEGVTESFHPIADYLSNAILDEVISDVSLANAVKQLDGVSYQTVEKFYNIALDLTVTRSLCTPNFEKVFNKEVNKTLVLCDWINKLSLAIDIECDESDWEQLFNDCMRALNQRHETFEHVVHLAYVLLKTKVCNKYPENSSIVKQVKSLGRVMSEKCYNEDYDQTKASSKHYNTYLNSKYMNILKNERENELDIILSEEEYIIPDGEYSDEKFRVVDTIVGKMKEQAIEGFRLRSILERNKNLTCELDSVDKFKYFSARPRKSFLMPIDADDCEQYITVAFDKNNIDILVKDKSNGDICYLPLVKNFCITPNMEYLYGDNSLNHMDCMIRRIRYKHDLFDLDKDTDVLTEGLTVTEDGGVKLVYKPQVSYMEDYSKLNKVIVQNARNNNVEGVKSDLVFLFSFINETEKIVKGKVKVKDSVKEDARKARMFATGDFRQYLAFAQERDPSFDFTKYFEEKNKDKGNVLIEFSNSEIKGMRLLLRTIMGY